MKNKWVSRPCTSNSVRYVVYVHRTLYTYNCIESHVWQFPRIQNHTLLLILNYFILSDIHLKSTFLFQMIWLLEFSFWFHCDGFIAVGHFTEFRVILFSLLETYVVCYFSLVFHINFKTFRPISIIVHLFQIKYLCLSSKSISIFLCASLFCVTSSWSNWRVGFWL